MNVINPNDHRFCSRAGCFEMGGFRPQLHIRYDPQKPVARITQNVYLCNAHKLEAEIAGVAEILSDELWDKILKNFAANGWPAPVRELTALHFLQLEPLAYHDNTKKTEDTAPPSS